MSYEGRGAFAVKLVYLIERPSSAVTSRYQVAIAMIVYCSIIAGADYKE